jgi:competence ComEA-like helix-hairpin-helix protein
MSRKININSAAVADLSKLPGVGAGLAERIVKYREEVGPFRTVGELAAVPGLDDNTLERINNRIALADGEEKPAELPPAMVRVVMSADQHDGYQGHRLFALFTRRELIDLYNGSKTSLWVPGQLLAELPRTGEVMLAFPNRADLQDNVTLRVYAPDGELLANTSLPAEKLPEKLELKVTPKAYARIEPNPDPDFGKPARLKGRVIDEAGRRQVAQAQVVIWAAEKEAPAAADFRALMVVETDPMGHFSGPWPRGRFSSAHGAVSLGREPVSVPIHLEKDKSFPQSVILPVDLDTVPVEDKSDSDCGCGTGEVVPRDPDMGDLTRADGTYSTDPGLGRCVDFTKPDRTLEEFTYSYVVRTTEPLIKGLTLKEPTKIDISAIAGLLARQQPAARNLLASAGVATELGDGEALMMKKPSLPQLPTDRIDARLLHTLSRDPDGFSLTQVAAAANLTIHGDILRIIGQTIGRQPGRTKLTGEQPVDWDDEPTIYQATSIAHGHVLRFKQEWVADGYSMGNLLYSLPLAPGQKKQIAIVDWERRESAGRTESISESESLEAMVSRDRDINEIVNATVNESVRGGSSASTGSFAAGLGIGAILGPVGGLLGIGGGTSSASSSAWQNSSRGTAANALNQLRDRTVQSASAVRSQRSSVVTTVRQGERVMATTETVANYNHCHAITIQYFEVLRHMLVRQRLTDVQECLFVPLMMSRFTSDKTLRWRNTLAGTVADRKLRAGFDALDRIHSHYVGSDLPTGSYADQLLDYMEGDLMLRFELARPKDKDDGFDASAWGFLSHLLPSISPSEFHKQYLKDQAFKDRIFLQELAPKIASAFVQTMRFFAVSPSNVKTALPVDATLVPDFVNDRPLYVSLRLSASLPAMTRKDVQYIEISDVSGVINLPFFQLLPAGSRVMVESANIRYRTKYSSGQLVRDGHVMNDLVGGDTVRMFTPLTSQELRNPREEDKELSRKLLDHLNENIERYHHALWWRMSPDRRYMLLDGFEAPASGGRSVASVVENELIGIVGNSLVMPVARGFHLDPTFRQNEREPIDLIEHYQPNTPIEPSRLAIPTRGVYAEAVMGACNSCETKEEQRFWRWEESPLPDSPPAILPTSTDTRRAAPPDLTAKDFAAPIIAMQNAPAAPDPTGLSAAMGLLGTPGLFKDITGLEGNQRNAAEALKNAFDTAQFFGGKAADLALQAKMNKDIDKAMRTIQTAKQQGLISKEQASQLSENAIRGLIGAGSAEQTKPLSKEDVQDVTESAGQNKASVKVSRPTGERVEVDARNQPGAQDTAAAVQLVLASNTGRAENRAFRPLSNDNSGVIDLEVQARNTPAGATLRWSPVDPGALLIENPNSNRTRVRGLRPGTTQLDCMVHDASGTQLATTRVQLSVPQFVRVTEDAAAFDAVLATLNISAIKDMVMVEARSTCEHLLRNSNVRTVWQVGLFHEALPTFLPASSVTVATFRGDPPAARPNLLGMCNPAGGSGGAAVFNETIDIFPGAYDNPVAGGSTNDVDVETRGLITQMESQAMSDPVMEQFAIKVYGRLLGETLAHEIVHSLLWTEVSPTYHNTPAVGNDLMNAGAERPFRQRTGLEGPMVSPVIPANYTDHGLNGIGDLQATNQALVSNHFPVPPAFA